MELITILSISKWILSKWKDKEKNGAVFFQNEKIAAIMGFGIVSLIKGKIRDSNSRYISKKFVYI